MEWGDVYAGVMTDCNQAIRPVHDRMHVLLQPDDMINGCTGVWLKLLHCRIGMSQRN